MPKFVDFPASLGGSGVRADSWDLHPDVTQAFHGKLGFGVPYFNTFFLMEPL